MNTKRINIDMHILEEKCNFGKSHAFSAEDIRRIFPWGNDEIFNCSLDMRT